MVDIIASVNGAIGIAKRLHDISKNIEDAEFKNLLADMSLSLANIKLELADFKEENAKLREQILELQKKNDLKLTYKKGMYFAVGDDDPFCPTCHGSSGKLIRMKFIQHNGYYNCPVCDYVSRM